MKRMILDCDPGVDDAYALALLCRAPGVSLVGVTTQCGNCSGVAAFKNAHTIARALRCDVPIVAGADRPLEGEPRSAEDVHGAGGLPGADLRGLPDPIAGEAPAWLCAQAAAHPGLTIVATGPLTNLAQAVRRDPAFVRHVGELVIMGGGSFGNVTPWAEFNFAHDPLAAATVLGAGFAHVRLVPLDATHQLAFTQQRFDELRPRASDAGAFLLTASEHYLRFYLSTGAPGFYMHDPLAAAWAIDDRIARGFPAHVTVVTHGEQAGRSMWDESAPPNAIVADTPDPDRFWEMLLPILAAEQ